MPENAGHRKATLNELIRRATGDRTPDRRRHLLPSRVYSVLQDPFWIWCDYHAPRSEAVDEKSRYDEMRFERANEFEQSWVNGHYPDAVRIRPDYGPEGLANTVKAMLEGVPALYQPHLWDLSLGSYGKGDLLVRDDRRGSDLGPYHYRAVEVKRSRTLQEYHILQAALYNRMLGKIQGYTPEEMRVVLRETEEDVPYAGREKEIDSVFLKWNALRSGERVPEPGRPPDVTDSPWRVYGEKLVKERWDLVLLAGVQFREREKLRAAGIGSVDRLWERRREEVLEILGEPAGTIAYHVARAYQTRQPIPIPGSRLSIPRAKRSLYFDFETSDDIHPTEPPHVYLIGSFDAGRDQYVRFLARGAGDEERIFREFLEHAGDRDDTLLYHWTAFELNEMKKAAVRWPSLAASFERLFSRCVDLKEAVKASVYLPVPTFSIKSVAPALGFEWRLERFGAFEAMVAYWDSLDGKDESGLRKAVLYNEDDCRAMVHIDRELARRLGQEQYRLSFMG